MRRSRNDLFAAPSLATAPRPTSSVNELSPRLELALLARALHREGFDAHNVGHITYRQEPDQFLTLPFGLSWDEVTPEDIVTLDGAGAVVDGRSEATPAIQLHLAFHAARSGCAVAVHHHPRFASVWACMGRLPPAYDQLGATLADARLTVYDDYRGGVDAVDAASAAVHGVGNADVALLQNHGVFVVADSIRQAHFRCIAFEWRCRQAWMVEAVGGGCAMPDYGVRSLVTAVEANGGLPKAPMWEWAIRRELRHDPSLLDRS